MLTPPRPGQVVRLGLALVIVAIAHLADISETSRLWAEIFNAGHVLLMGGFSLVMLGFSREVLAAHFSRRQSHYLLAFGVTVLVGALAEIAQIPGPRDADVMDVVRDAAGAFAFLSAHALWCREPWLDGRIRRLILSGSIVLVLASVWTPTAIWVGAFWHRDRIFPTLATFDSNWETKFWTVANATLVRTPAPPEWSEHGADQAGRVDSRPSSRAGFAINLAYPDWSAYHSLQMSVFLAGADPADYTVQIKSQKAVDSTADLLTCTQPLAVGANLVIVPFDSAKRLPGGGLLDLSAITTVYFYTSDTTRPITLYVDNIELK